MSGFFLFGLTDQGLRRKKNEDVVLVDTDLGFCLVADGIGGVPAGEVASQTFARTASHVFQNCCDGRKTMTELVTDSFRIANEDIFAYAEANSSCKGMGCTAELICFEKENFFLGHIGDSRTYRLRLNTFEQLTTDHSLVQEQLDLGMITPEEARNHSLKNVILKAVGIQKEISVDILSGKISPGDIFLLCSDGLSDMLDDQSIKTCLSDNVDIKKKAQLLIQAANNAGGKDNISVAIAQIV